VPPEFQAHGVIGRSAAMARVLREAARIAPLDVPVLVTGRQGTGKSLLARLIHQNSRRRAGNLVEICCAALPDTMADSEIIVMAAVLQAARDGSTRVEASHVFGRAP
jgi:Nif-specific regulatory protein